MKKNDMIRRSSRVLDQSISKAKDHASNLRRCSRVVDQEKPKVNEDAKKCLTLPSDECHNTKRLNYKPPRPPVNKHCDVSGEGPSKSKNSDDTHDVSKLSLELPVRSAVSQQLYTKCYVCGVYSANMENHQKIHSEPFKCLDCKLNFVSKLELEKHRKLEHSNTKIMKCFYCWETFESIPLLVKHAKASHKGLNNKFECSVCGKPCQDNHALSVHQLVHTKEKPHRCKECDKAYALESSLVLHMKTHNTTEDNFKHKCSVCSKGFIKRSALKAHKETHNEDRKGNWVLCPHVTPTYKTTNNNFPVFCQMCDGAAVCNFCGFSFENKQMYMAHTHNNFCTICGIKFFDGKFYKRHQLYHLKDTKLKCNACMYGFETLPSFALHNSKQHSIPTPKSTQLYQCSKCAKEYTTKQNLDIHVKKEHSKEKKFQCLICEARFITKTLYEIHKKKHDPLKTNYLQCDICDKKFFRKTDLNRHLMTHSDEKPFSCNICGISVKSNRNLRLHMDTHSKKLYECKQCHKHFRQKCYLKLHLKVHDGSKPFKCDKCDKSFLKQQGLDEHMPTHLGISNYQCENCEQYFCSAYSLRKHTLHKFCIEEEKLKENDLESGLDELEVAKTQTV